MTDQGKCIALIRKPGRTREAALAERSAVIFEHIIEPAASSNRLACIQVDPSEYGPHDERLFALLASAEVVVVDASGHSIGLRIQSWCSTCS